MEIHFDDPKFERVCNNHRALIKSHGQREADIIRRRLDDLDAAGTLAEIRNLPGRCHELLGNRAGQLSLDLVHPRRLIFTPFENPYPKKADGGMDWTKITAILIVGIEDTHE